MNKKIKNIILVIFICAILTGVYFLLNSIFNKEKEEEFLKNYGANEYIPTYVTEESMARIYLNDYISTMYFDVEAAYNLLDKEYRNKKFGSLQNYKNYVNSLGYQSYDVLKYSIISIDGYNTFEIYDKNGNYYAFKTKGVMEYSVYLDNYTIEIG